MDVLILDTVNKSIELSLGEAHTTNPVDVTANWADSGTAFTEGSTQSQSNGTTPVTIVAAPAASTRRLVKTITIHNNDTVAHIIIFKVNVSSTLYFIYKTSLPAGVSWNSNSLDLTNALTLAGITPGAGGLAILDDASTAAVVATLGLDTPTSMFANAMPENVAIILDAALSADGKYSGIAEAGTAGTALAFGDLVYLAAADSRWELADADAAATAGPVQLGICVLAAAADGDPTTILRYGKVRADAVFPALTVGAPVYVDVTAGDVTVTAPSGTADIVRIVGYGNTADELFFCPDNTFIELA